MNQWLLPTTLFLLGTTVWLVAYIFAKKQAFGFFGIISAGLAGAGVFLFFQRDYPAVGGISLCIAVLLPLIDVGLNILSNKNIATSSEGFVGKEGICITPLEPKGKIQIEEQLLPAISEGLFLPEGEKVRVIRSSSRRVVVEKIDN